MRFAAILFGICIVLFFPVIVSAHGGVANKAGSVMVYLKQDPISPFVGEEVRLTLTLRDENRPSTGSMNDQNLVNWPVTVSVIDTYYGDQVKDRVIYRQQFTTDLNASFNFSYTFTKENYFDIDLDFTDASGNPQETGFLVQPRMNTGPVKYSKYHLWDIVVAMVIGALAMLTASRIRHKLKL